MGLRCANSVLILGITFCSVVYGDVIKRTACDDVQVLSCIGDVGIGTDTCVSAAAQIDCFDGCQPTNGSRSEEYHRMITEMLDYIHAVGICTDVNW